MIDALGKLFCVEERRLLGVTLFVVVLLFRSAVSEEKSQSLKVFSFCFVFACNSKRSCSVCGQKLRW